MSAKQRRAPVAPAGSAQADAEAEIWEYYDRLRQRAAEKPLQTRVLSRAGGELSPDEKERWLQFGELKRDRLVSTIDGLISELESEPHIDAFKKRSIVRAVWSIIQSEFDDAFGAIRLERKASEHGYKSKATQSARSEVTRISRERMHIAKKFVDAYITRHPDASVSVIAKHIFPVLNSELIESNVPAMESKRTLRGLISGILTNAEPNGRRSYQKRITG